MGQCTIGLVVMVIVMTGLYHDGRWGGGRVLTALRPFLEIWVLGIHLNGPLASVSI